MTSKSPRSSAPALWLCGGLLLASCGEDEPAADAEVAVDGGSETDASLAGDAGSEPAAWGYPASVGALEPSLDTTGLDVRDPAPEPPGLIVEAMVETEAVSGGGDAADDPAIWVNPSDPAESLVIGTDKTINGGLNVYGMDGSLRQFVPIGEINNVDLRQGFQLDGEEVTLVTATNRSNDTLAIYALDHDTRMLRNVAKREVGTSVGNYGTCMYRSSGGDYYAFVNHTDGTYQQFRLYADGDEVDAELVRTFCVQTQPEGCVADDETGMLYVGEEAYGIWKFAADPAGAAPGATKPDCDTALEGLVVDDIEGTIVADVEGLTVADMGGGTGYLIASGQGANAFYVYDREPPHAHVRTFQVWGGGQACLDGVNETDGIDVTTSDLGPGFEHGMLVVQDGKNGDPLSSQNFKYIPFELVENPAFTPGGADCFVSDLGGDTQQEAILGDGPDRTQDFCNRFCARCGVCYTMPETGFAEGDCHYLSPKPVFDEDDCLAGCAAGLVPQTTGPLTPGWESWECGALDSAL